MTLRREKIRGTSRRRQTTGTMKRKLLSVVLSLVLILGLIPMSVFGEGWTISTITPASSNSPKVDASIDVGDTLTVPIKNDSSSSDYNFTISFSDDSVASSNPTSIDIDHGVTKNIDITGLKSGKTTVTISNNNSKSERKATINLTVEEPEEGTVKITPTTYNPTVNAKVDVEGTLKIKVTNGSSSDYTFTVTSRDTTVATVSHASQLIAGKGFFEFTVTGVEEGKTVINISNNAENGERKGTINLTVGEYVEPEEPTATETIAIKATMNTPAKKEVNIDVDEILKIELETGSSSSDKTYESVSEAPDTAEVIFGAELKLAQSTKGNIYVKGIAKGKTTISIASTDNKCFAEITVIVGDYEEPEEPVAPTADKTVEITSNKNTTTKTESIGVGKILEIKLKNGSTGNSKSYANVSADPETAEVVFGGNFDLAKSAEGSVFVKGVKEGTTTITCTGSGSGDAYIAVINLTVGESTEPEEPVAPTADDTVKIVPNKTAEVSAKIGVGKTLEIEIENVSQADKKYTSVSEDSETAKVVFGGEIEIAANNGKGSVFVEGIKEGQTTITCTGTNTGGSTYTAIINLTVGESAEPEEPEEQEISVTPATNNPTVSAAVGEKETLKIEVKNGSENNKSYEFTVKSSDTSIATISPASKEIAAGDTAEFTVTGEKEGKTVITISNNNTEYGEQYERKATINLTVGKSVVLSDTSVKLPIGEKKTITATVIGSQDTVTWISSDTKVATVEDGEITAVAAGTATITAKLSETIYAECKVTVTDPAAPITTTYLAFSSDVHNGSGSVSSADRLNKWINTLAEKNDAPFDMMGFSGDMGPASGSSSSFWNEAQEVMDVVEGSKNVLNGGFYVCGNHEFNPGSYTHNANDTTKKYSDPGDYVEEDSYILYSMGARSGSENYSDADINALSSFLDSHSDFGGPIFILAHFPLHCYNNQSGESTTIHDGKAAAGSSKLIAALNSASDDYGLTIFFLWGHNHSGSNDHYDKVYTDKINNTDISFTYAAAGCMSDSEYGASANVKGKGLVAQIESDSVILTYYDANGNVVGTGAEVEIKGTTPAVTHTITVTNGAHGTISPSGKVTVKEGRTQTFKITPDAKYEIDTVLVDGKSITVVGNTFKVENVTKDITVSVTYKEAQGQSYEEADKIAAGGKYIIVSNGYALTNNNGEISATPVSVDKDGIFITNGNISSMTWELSSAAGTDKAGDYVIKNNGYMLSRVSDESGSTQPAEITTQEKYSDASTLPYFQWSYKNGILSQIGGQDQSATFVVYYDSNNGAFYTENEASQTVTFYSVEGSVEPQPGENPTIDINYALNSKVSFKDSETLVIDCSRACFVLAKDSDGNYSRIAATKQADGTYAYDLSKVSGDFSITIGLMGDMDLNGEVDMVDATAVMMSWVNNTELKGIKSFAADVNGTDGVNMADATAVMMSWVNNTSLNWN